MKNTLYVMVSTDEYELPVAVAESIKELSRLTGFAQQTLFVYMGRGYRVFKVKEETNEE